MNFYLGVAFYILGAVLALMTVVVYKRIDYPKARRFEEWARVGPIPVVSHHIPETFMFVFLGLAVNAFFAPFWIFQLTTVILTMVIMDLILRSRQRTYYKDHNVKQDTFRHWLTTLVFFNALAIFFALLPLGF